MKKILLALMLTMVLVLTACAGATDDSATTGADDTSTGDSTTTDDDTSDDSSKTDASSSFAEVPFKLISGTPPIPDPSPLVYEGSVKLSGWIIYKPAYVGEDVAHFRVVDENLDKLPADIRGKRTEFVLVVIDANGQVSQAPQSVVDEITAASEAGPATIIVDRLNWGAEGSPSLNFVELVRE